MAIDPFSDIYHIILNFIHFLAANTRQRHSSVPKWVRLPTDCLDAFLSNSFSCSSAWPERKYVKKERAKATCECRETLENDDSYLDLPRGAEWMTRGAYTPSLRVQTAPFGRWYDLIT